MIAINHGLFLFLQALKNKPNTVFLSTAYLPPIEYFYFLQQVENAFVEADETYQKQTYRNRCVIYSEKGKLTLTLPVSKPFGNQTKTKEILIFNEARWQMNHWRAIYAAYQASPYFLYYKHELEFIFRNKHKLLFDLNLEITKKLCQIIGIKTQINTTKEFVKQGTQKNDHRFDISPKVNPTIENFPAYVQVFSDRHGFIKNLSILDLLFNLGPDSLNYLKSIGKYIETTDQPIES